MTFRFVLEAAAMTLVFTRGTIFTRVREAGPGLWRELAKCPLCAGVWVGAGWTVFRAWSAPASTLERAADALAAGALTGVLALFLVLLWGVLER